MRLSNVKVMSFLIWTRLIGTIHQQRKKHCIHIWDVHLLLLFLDISSQEQKWLLK